MLKIGQNWGKIANYPPQCSTKVCITAYAAMLYLTMRGCLDSKLQSNIADYRGIGSVTERNRRLGFSYWPGQAKNCKKLLFITDLLLDFQQ